MNKILLIVGIIACLGTFSAIFLHQVINNIPIMEATNQMENKLYQGPVPQGHDLQHFRETGKTTKEVTE